MTAADPQPLAFTAAVCGPDDTLVLSTPERMSAERCEQIKDQLAAVLGDEIRVAVLTGMAVTVVSAA